MGYKDDRLTRNQIARSNRQKTDMFYRNRSFFRYQSSVIIAAGLGLCFLVLAGCSVNPATGQQDFAPFMSPAEELRVGAQEHPKILKEFGGAYDDPDLAAYVDSVGQFLTYTAELPNLRFTFTILDSPVVNAFALPGGYIYVTRGLLALANNEAELAAVLAHEIGHVTGRHSAQRYSQAVSAQIGLTALGAFGLGSTVGQFLSHGTGLYLRSYSRDQEYEADQLGVRYLNRAGFSPYAMASFLDHMGAYDSLERKLSGNKAAIPSFLSTHPQTADRVHGAIETARGSQVVDPITAQGIYLDKIDGLVYGDAPDEGVIEGRRFLNPVLGFGLTVPPGFEPKKIPNGMIAVGPDQAEIFFDTLEHSSPTHAITYLNHAFGSKGLQRVEALSVNDFSAATGQVQVKGDGSIRTIQVVALEVNPYLTARLAFSAPAGQFPKWSKDFRRTTYQFRRLTTADADSIKIRRIVVVTVQPGEDVNSLAQRMVVEKVQKPHSMAEIQKARFLVLNGFREGHILRPGDRVKVVLRESAL